MRLALLLAASVALVTAQRRVAAPPQYKVRDDGAAANEGGKAPFRTPVHTFSPVAAAAGTPKAEESGFVRPIDFSGLLRDSILGAEASSGVPAFGGSIGGPLYSAPAAAPAVFQQSAQQFQPSVQQFQPSVHEFQPFGAEPQKAATDEGKGFVEPTVRFRSLFDGGAGSDGGFRVQDFLTAHASSQKEVEQRVHAAAEGLDDDDESGGRRAGGGGGGRRKGREDEEDEGRRRAAATEHRVYHGGDEEEGAEDDEEGGRHTGGRPYRGPSQVSSEHEGKRGPATFGHSDSSPYSSAASSPHKERHYQSEEPYYGPDYSKVILEADKEEEESAGSSPKKAAAAKGKGKRCKKIAKKVTPEDVGKGRFRRAAGANKPAMTCYVCEDPENGGSYESCAYGSSPSDKSYFVSRAFSSNGKGPGPGKQYRQRRYLPDVRTRLNSFDDAYASGTNAEESKEDVPEYANAASSEGDAKMAYEAIPGDSYDENFRRLFPEFTYREASASSPSVASASALNPSEEEEESDGDEESAPGSSGGPGRTPAATEEKATDYGYKGPPAEFFLDTAQKKHLEKLVGEFSQKDRTACKKVMKDKMTCFQCIDEKGVQHEECMFVAKSDPKGRHLAYHELKEYRLVPDGAAGGRGFASVAGSAALPSYVSHRASAALPDSSASPASLVSPLRVPAPSVAASENRKKVHSATGGKGSEERAESVEVEEEEEGDRLTPAEAAIADGVYADETSNVFDPVRKIHLPKYMLKKSEHEAVFEEFVKASHETEE